MSLWKQLVASFKGTPTNVICDDEGMLITTPHVMYHVHLGEVFQISSYFGDQTADNAETNLLIQVGSTNDVHLISLEAVVQGFWELEIFEGPAFTAAGTTIDCFDANRFTANTCDATFTNTPTLVSTTVDANSGASEAGLEDILNVTATTNFVVGDWVLIEKGVEREFAQIASIQTGVSLTMEDNLTGSYVGTDTVESCGERIAYTHAEGGEKQKATGAGAGTGGEWVFKSGQDFLLRMTNRSGATARASNIIWWAEKAKQT